MEHIYTTEQNQKLLLYYVNNQIHLRTMNRENISRPNVLCSDYARDLTSTICNGTIYYAYVSTEHSLLVKSITENGSLFRLAHTDSLEYFQPQILVFNKQLLLFYVMQNPVDHSYSVKCVFPFQQEVHVTIPDSFPILPKVAVFPADDYVFINIYNDFFHKILKMDAQYQCSVLGNREDFEEERNEMHAQEMDALNGTMDKLKEDLHIKETQLIERDKLLRSQNAMIESAKKQYNELMDVASQYREEAIKWRSKFYVE